MVVAGLAVLSILLIASIYISICQYKKRLTKLKSKVSTSFLEITFFVKKTGITTLLQRCEMLGEKVNNYGATTLDTERQLIEPIVDLHNNADKLELLIDKLTKLGKDRLEYDLVAPESDEQAIT
jgi:hypothetical protein